MIEGPFLASWFSMLTCDQSPVWLHGSPCGFSMRPQLSRPVCYHNPSHLQSATEMLHQLLKHNQDPPQTQSARCCILLSLCQFRGLGASDMGKKSRARLRGASSSSLSPQCTLLLGVSHHWARCQHPLKAMPGICPLPGSAL